MLRNLARGRHKYFVLALALLLLVCMTATLTSCGSPSFSQATQDKLTATVQKVMSDNHVPGAIVGIWQKGKGQYIKAFGKAAVAPGQAMTTGDLWKVASVTKTFTANVILQLVGQGKLSLDDKLSKFDWSVGIVNRDQITVRMLLNHTSGLPDLENDDPAFQKVRYGDPTRVWTHAEILKWVRTLKPLSPPGQAYNYSNSGYYLLGMMIESVTGKTAADEIQTLCADKLSLENTRLADMPAYLLSKPHSDGYVSRAGLPPGIELPGKAPVDNATGWNTTAGWTSAGVDSGLLNLKTWIEAVYSGTLLTPAMRAEQLKNPVQMTESPAGPHYGLGVAITKLPAGELRWHNGATLGYSTFAGSIADGSITIVVFMNMMPAANGDSTMATGIVAPLLTIVQGQATK